MHVYKQKSCMYTSKNRTDKINCETLYHTFPVKGEPESRLLTQHHHDSRGWYKKNSPRAHDVAHGHQPASVGRALENLRLENSSLWF